MERPLLGPPCLNARRSRFSSTQPKATRRQRRERIHYWQLKIFLTRTEVTTYTKVDIRKARSTRQKSQRSHPRREILRTGSHPLSEQWSNQFIIIPASRFSGEMYDLWPFPNPRPYRTHVSQNRLFDIDFWFSALIASMTQVNRFDCPSEPTFPATIEMGN